jgi:hypothetical protein
MQSVPKKTDGDIPKFPVLLAVVDAHKCGGKVELGCRFE